MSNAEWQRTTALRKIGRDRDAAVAKGALANDDVLIRNAAAYVGASPDQVRRWVQGRG